MAHAVHWHHFARGNLRLPTAAAQVVGSQQMSQSRSAAVGNFQFHPATEGDLIITMEDLLAFTSSSTHKTGPSPATGMPFLPIFPAPRTCWSVVAPTAHRKRLPCPSLGGTFGFLDLPFGGGSGWWQVATVQSGR